MIGAFLVWAIGVAATALLLMSLAHGINSLGSNHKTTKYPWTERFVVLVLLAVCAGCQLSLIFYWHFVGLLITNLLLGALIGVIWFIRD